MDFEVAKSVFNSLYSGVDGYAISSRARKNISYSTKAHTYGEVTPEGFSQMLKDAGGAQGNFYDLGSGTGKAVVLASMFGNFSKLTGIEILQELYESSTQTLKRYEQEVRPILSPERQGQSLSFINTDFLSYDLNDANFIFSHSTCFYDELISALERKLVSLKPKTRVLLVTKTFKSPFFRLFKSGEYTMTWGKATVNFYEKSE